MMIRSALISASCVLGLSCGGAWAQDAQQARPPNQQPSHKGQAMRECNRQMKAGGMYGTLTVEQRRKAMTACLQARQEVALKQAEADYRAGVARR